MRPTRVQNASGPRARQLSASVQGPAARSVADARVEQAAGAAVAFAVMLSRGATHRVTVDYRTRDGSAQAGEDLEAASGMLTFAAGESSKTIEVGVLDDAHDEGEETSPWGCRTRRGRGSRTPRRPGRSRTRT